MALKIHHAFYVSTRGEGAELLLLENHDSVTERSISIASPHCSKSLEKC